MVIDGSGGEQDDYWIHWQITDQALTPHQLHSLNFANRGMLICESQLGK